MRLSVRKDDPGYSPFAVGAKVFLNGEELPLCITADEERGYAVVYDPDDEGKAHIVEGPRGPDVAIYSVYGDIRIVPTAAHRAHLGAKAVKHRRRLRERMQRRIDMQTALRIMEIVIRKRGEVFVEEFRRSLERIPDAFWPRT